MEPSISAKSTVSCLRSPSSAAFDVRIFSARCLGVEVSGETKRDCGALVGWAHAGQNLAVGESCVPQLAQMRASCVAHSSQNFAPMALSCPHLKHRRDGLSDKASAIIGAGSAAGSTVGVAGAGPSLLVTAGPTNR